MAQHRQMADGRGAAPRPARPGLRSLFIDGGQAHAHLRLPLAVEGARHSQPALVRLTRTHTATEVDELAPHEGDLIPFTFRLLSAAYLGAGGYHLDFSREGVLHAALSLFREPEAEGSARQSPLVVVRDHSFAIEDRIGLVHGARWSPPDDGLLYPGIDAELHIDWKLAGEVVRRLLHDPPLLDACSVSLGFRWEKSHPELDDSQFWGRQGEELDGSLVRVVVAEVISVEHVGLVFAGADPSAKKRDREVPEPAGATMTASLSGGPEIKEKGDLQMERKAITVPPESPLWDLLGADKPDLSGPSTQLRTSDQTDLRLLERRAGELKELAQLGRETLVDLRREVGTLIMQLDGTAESGPFDSGQGRPSEGLVKMVQAADMATLRALKDEYARRLDRLMPARCQVCGSQQVSRRSSRESVLPAQRPARPDGGDPGLYR